MKLGIVSGPRYYRVIDQYYTSTSFHAEMWKECLEVFDEVVIADRVVYTDKVETGQKPVLADGITFFEMPSFKGALSLGKTVPRMFWRAKKAIRQADVWHLHCPNFVSLCMWFWARYYKVPYSVELRGYCAVNAIYLKLRGLKFPRFTAAFMRFLLNLELSRPLAVVGVSKSLIRDFPPGNGCPTFAISDNRVPETSYRHARLWQNDSRSRTIVSLGSLEAIKNPFGIIRSLHLLTQKGFTNWKFVWIGDGPLKGEAQQLADQLGLSDCVNFLGFVPWNNVFDILKRADLYLLYSLSEGLPRALLEAMACALPAIGSNVGGVSELLHENDIVPSLDDEMLADKLYEVITDPKRLTEMSRRNLNIAKSYSAEILSAQKIDFYARIKSFITNEENY